MSLIRMKNQEKIKALLNGMHVYMQGNAHEHRVLVLPRSWSLGILRNLGVRYGDINAVTQRVYIYLRNSSVIVKLQTALLQLCSVRASTGFQNMS